MSAFIYMNSNKNSHPWIDDYEIMKVWVSNYEFIHEFSAVKNFMKAWLNSFKWIHIWNHGWFQTEVHPFSATNQLYKVVKMLVPAYEFITHPKIIVTPSLQSALCHPWAYYAAWWKPVWWQPVVALLHLLTWAVTHHWAVRTWKALQAHNEHKWR